MWWAERERRVARLRARMVELHQILGVLAIAVNAVAGAIGGLTLWRHVEPWRAYAHLVALGQTTLIGPGCRRPAPALVRQALGGQAPLPLRCRCARRSALSLDLRAARAACPAGLVHRREPARRRAQRSRLHDRLVTVNPTLRGFAIIILIAGRDHGARARGRACGSLFFVVRIAFIVAIAIFLFTPLAFAA